jgi:Protein of unknown function (DUF3892)
MPDPYQIVCVNTEHPHRHIIRVGTGHGSGLAERLWSVEEVRRALDENNAFFTVSPSTNRIAYVHVDDCPEPGCTVQTIQTYPDAVPDNNLDNLRECNW